MITLPLGFHLPKVLLLSYLVDSPVRARQNWKGWQVRNSEEISSAVMLIFSGIIIPMPRRLKPLTNLTIPKLLLSMPRNGTMACGHIAKTIA